jgi:hypothetical protein
VRVRLRGAVGGMLGIIGARGWSMMMEDMILTT